MEQLIRLIFHLVEEIRYYEGDTLQFKYNRKDKDTFEKTYCYWAPDYYPIDNEEMLLTVLQSYGEYDINIEETIDKAPEIVLKQR